ncbi:MAG: NADH-quinone oxidoreductase subunit C [Chloroflexi bacterium]|nr:NADH-quinone oxidoreductase subunit C [Chloroflexota bacterium]
MTLALSGDEIAATLGGHFPGSVIEASKSHLLVKSESLFDIASYLKTAPGLDFDFLCNITAVDCFDYFEIVYQFTSLKHNHGLVVKARCHDRSNPVLPSLVSLWRGADLQEREIYDLMGITFQGHPNLKRIFLWEDFDGHPLRKDYL